MKCNHRYVDIEDGTNDKLCVRCNKKAKQNYFHFIDESTIEVTAKVARNVNEKTIEHIANEIGAELERRIILNQGNIC